MSAEGETGMQAERLSSCVGLNDGSEVRWIAEQDSIAQAVIDTDDTSWLLHQATGGEGCDGTLSSGVTSIPQDDKGERTTVANHAAAAATPAAAAPAINIQEQSPEDLGGRGCPGRQSGDSSLPRSSLPVRRLQLVGGVDVSFVKGSDENACASLVILAFPSLCVVYEAYERVTMEYPYKSGFLAFREVGHLSRLVEQLRRERPDLEPDVLFVDGNGRLHPRGAGLACHLGVVTGLRTVGLGKTFLHVDGLTKSGVRGRVRDVLSSGERESQLVGESGTVWGTALVPREEGKGCAVTNPVFVSVGHRVSLETGVALTKAVGRYRLPEPIRQADMRSREVVRLWLQEQVLLESALEIRPDTCNTYILEALK